MTAKFEIANAAVDMGGLRIEIVPAGQENQNLIDSEAETIFVGSEETGRAWTKEAIEKLCGLPIQLISYHDQDGHRKVSRITVHDQRGLIVFDVDRTRPVTAAITERRIKSPASPPVLKIA